jgi:hypothetical protein
VRPPTGVNKCRANMWGFGWQRVCSDETAVVHIRTAETAPEHRANQGEAVRLTDLGYEPWLEHAFGREVRIRRLPGSLIMTAIGGTRTRQLR